MTGLGRSSREGGQCVEVLDAPADSSSREGVEEAGGFEGLGRGDHAGGSLVAHEAASGFGGDHRGGAVGVGALHDTAAGSPVGTDSVYHDREALRLPVAGGGTLRQAVDQLRAEGCGQAGGEAGLSDALYPPDADVPGHADDFLQGEPGHERWRVAPWEGDGVTRGGGTDLPVTVEVGQSTVPQGVEGLKCRPQRAPRWPAPPNDEVGAGQFVNRFEICG